MSTPTSDATTLDYEAEAVPAQEMGPPDLGEWLETAVDNPGHGIEWNPMEGWWQDEVPSDAEAFHY